MKSLLSGCIIKAIFKRPQREGPFWCPRSHLEWYCKLSGRKTCHISYRISVVLTMIRFRNLYWKIVVILEFLFWNKLRRASMFKRMNFFSYVHILELYIPGVVTTNTFLEGILWIREILALHSITTYIGDLFEYI